MVGRVKLFLLALFFLFHTTTFAYFPICCGCFLAFLVVAYPDISFFAFLGYIFVFLIHYVSYFPCFLVFVYPDISFFAFFGVHSCLPHTLCFIFFLFFSGCVPRYFIFSLFSGYFFVFLIHYVSYFSCFLVVTYPDISFLTFFGVRAFVHHLLWLQHTPIHRKRTPTFYFYISLGTLLNCLTYFPPPLCTKRIPCGTSLHTVSFN